MEHIVQFGINIDDAAASRLHAAFACVRDDLKYRTVQLAEADEKIIAELNANAGESMVQKHV